MEAQQLHSVAVAGAVFRPDGHILVIRRRDNDHWEAPGGILERGESFESGVRREILEETGVEVAVKRLSGVYKNLVRDIVVVVFECVRVSGIAIPTSEAAEVCWLPIEEASARMSPAHAARIMDALADAAQWRSHDGKDLLPAG